MKLKACKLIFLCFVLIFSCKDHTTQTKTNQGTPKIEQETIKKSNRFIFDIDLETSHPDDFRLIADNIFLNNNQFMNISILHKLNSNETSKKMHFELPEGVQPDYQIGFSFGSKHIKEVKINSIKVSYGEIEYNISKDELIKYFRLNNFTEYNSETGIIKTKKVRNKHNPMIFLRNNFINKINNL